MLAYWNDDDPTTVRNRKLDFPPSDVDHEFVPPTSIKDNATTVHRSSKSTTINESVPGSSKPDDTQVNDPSSENVEVENANQLEDTRHTISEPMIDSSDESVVQVWAYDGISSAVNHFSEEPQTNEMVTEWLKQTIKQMKTALQQFNLQAKLKSEIITSNSALLKFEGSSHLTVEQVSKRQSEFLTTYGLKIFSVQPEPGLISIAIARPQREVVDLSTIWKKWSPIFTEGNQEIAIGVRENEGSLLFLDPSQNMHHTHSLRALQVVESQS